MTYFPIDTNDIFPYKNQVVLYDRVHVFITLHYELSDSLRSHSDLIDANVYIGR